MSTAALWGKEWAFEVHAQNPALVGHRGAQHVHSAFEFVERHRHERRHDLGGAVCVVCRKRGERARDTIAERVPAPAVAMNINVFGHGVSLDALPGGLMVLRPRVVIAIGEPLSRRGVKQHRDVGVELDG